MSWLAVSMAMLLLLRGNAQGAGVALALAALTRPTALVCLPLFALFAGRKKAVPLLIAAALTLAPWMARNYLRFGEIIVVNDAASYSVWHASHPETRRIYAADTREEFKRRELEFARHTNERTRASYLAPNFEPVAAAGKFTLVDGDVELLPGIRVRLTPGHVPFHQSVLISNGDETACFLGDIVPTSAHLPLPWIMGYDLEPLRSLETKRALLADAAREGWRLIFEHDPRVAMGRAGEGQLTEVVAVD